MRNSIVSWHRAGAKVFLESPRASFISGTNLVVDGTLTMRVQG